MLSEHEGGGSDKSEDSSSSDSDSSSPSSPPRVDDSPLQKCMDRNKQCERAKFIFAFVYFRRQIVSMYKYIYKRQDLCDV